MTQSASAQQLIQGVQDYIRNAMDIMESGEYTELTGLDERVAELCSYVQNLPVGEATQYTKQLEELTGQLDKLKEVMEEHKDAVQSEISGLSDSQQASHAYAKSGALLPKKSSEE